MRNKGGIRSRHFVGVDGVPVGRAAMKVEESKKERNAEQAAAEALLEQCLSPTIPDSSVKLSPLTGNGFNMQYQGKVYDVAVTLIEDDSSEP